MNWKDRTALEDFDILTKVAALEVEGLEAGLRLDGIREVFEAQSSFAPTSAIGKRIKSALDFLNKGFKHKGSSLRTRTMVQSLITLTCKIIATGRATGREIQIRKFFETFMSELAEQVEMGRHPVAGVAYSEGVRASPWRKICSNKSAKLLIHEAASARSPS